MIYQTLYIIFNESPFEKRFTSVQVKKELYRRLGCECNDREFYDAFIELRDSGRLPIYKVKENGLWKYIKSKSDRVKIKHNAHLAYEQKRAEKRKVRI